MFYSYNEGTSQPHKDIRIKCLPLVDLFSSVDALVQRDSYGILSGGSKTQALSVPYKEKYDQWKIFHIFDTIYY